MISKTVLEQLEDWIATDLMHKCTQQYPSPGYASDFNPTCTGCLIVAAALEMRKAAPSHPGPSIEKAFTNSPRQVEPSTCLKCDAVRKLGLMSCFEHKQPESYVQYVPGHCDRIVWRGSYYMLPLPSAPSPVETTAPQPSRAVWESMWAAIAREIDATKDPATKHRLITLHANSTLPAAVEPGARCINWPCQLPFKHEGICSGSPLCSAP